MRLISWPSGEDNAIPVLLEFVYVGVWIHTKIDLLCFIFIRDTHFLLEESMFPLVYEIKGVITLFKQVSGITNKPSYKTHGALVSKAPGIKQNTSHVWFTLMTLYGVIIQASEVWSE